MAYIRSLKEESAEGGCFLCRYWSDPEADAANHVVWRTASTLVVMNRFPYSNGHLLIAHARHRADLTDLSEAELADMGRATRDAVSLLGKVLSPQGFNVGYNLGQCAGAGLPGHLHAHVVPRWSGDTNFMAVIDDVRVIPDALSELHGELVNAASAIGLRRSDI